MRFPILLSRALSRAAVLSLITGAVLGGCGKDPAAPPVITNSPPRITQLYSHPLRAHIHENIRVVVNALDPDRDLMAYSWTASRGSFPEGNQNNVVVWRTGTAPGVDTVTVHVQDYTHVVSDVMVIPVFTTSPPLALSFELGPSNADLSWPASADEGIDYWVGYQVFQATRSFAEIAPDSIESYRVATVSGTTRHWRATRLAQGTRYYFRVRSYRAWPGGEERSVLGTQVDLAPRAYGNLVVNEFASPTGGTGIDLSIGYVRPLDPADASGMADQDVYFGTADSLDRSGPIVLKSVSMLSGRNPDWSGRRVGIKQIGMVQADWGTSTTTDDGWQESVAIATWGVYAIRLPEGNYAKIQVTSVAGTYPRRFVQIRYAFQPIPDYARF